MSGWKPNYGDNKFKKKNRYSQEDGDVVFRILPQPKGNNEDYSPDWSKYLSVHFGYKNSQGKARPFQSCQVKVNKEVTVQDPALVRLNALKDKLAAYEAEGDTEKAAKIAKLVGFNGVYNVDNNHYMNVIGLDGGIGVLKIRYTAKQALDEEIRKLRAAGVDPLDFETGRFFVFSRSGTGRETAFKVDVYREQIDALTSRQVVHKVTDEIKARLETEGFNLETEVSAKVSPEEIAQIVAESDLETGKSPAVDRIIDARWKNARNSRPAAVAPKPTATTAPSYTAPTASAPEQAPAAPKTVAPTATSKPLDEQSDADFFKDLGV